MTIPLSKPLSNFFSKIYIGNLAQFERIGVYFVLIANKDEFQSYVQGLTDELKSTIEQKITFHRLKSTINL